MGYLLVGALAFFLGWYLRELRNILLRIQKRLERLAGEPEEVKPQASFAEPLTAAQLAAIEQRETIKRLNPDVEINENQVR